MADASAPEVVFVKPVEDLQVTQGSTVSIEVDATAAAGRSIQKVELLADDVVMGAPDVLVPYQFLYTVPLTAATNSTIVLKARATDNLNSQGTSAGRQLFVKNDPPVASFSAIITGNLQVSVDASGVHDTETGVADLQVRWDWENNGSWDTDWSTTKTATHVYGAGGSYTIAMQVKDSVDQVTATTRTVDFQLVQDISGEITSTMWMGTINITGDAWVKAGETLTIASGTTIVFYQMDTNSDGVGDYDLEVRGKIVVQGTAANPVIFTVAPPTGQPKKPKGWNKVMITSSSSGSTLDHAIFEYADVGLDLRAPAALTACEFRYNRLGLYANAVNTAITLTDVYTHDNTSDGLQLYASKVTSTGLMSVSNGGDGVNIRNGTSGMSFTGCTTTENANDGFDIYNAQGVTVTDCSITYNGGTGILFGSANGTVNHCQIKYNDQEGVRAVLVNSSYSGPVVEWNNIFGNGAVGAMVIETVNLSASTNASYYGTQKSSTWSTPNGETIQWVEEGYSEYDYDYYNYENGYLQTAGGASMLSHSTSASNAWTDISANASSSVVAVVVDNQSSSYYATETVSRVAYIKQGAGKQVTVLSNSAALGAAHNYLGVFPDVLQAVSYTTTGHLGLQGFVETAFDDTWSPGRCHGGETINADTLWNQNVYITGNVSVASGKTLTIPAGVVVTFVPTDQDANNVGDWTLDRKDGNLTATGTSDSPVLFTVLGTVPTGGGYYSLGGTGGGTTSLTWAVVEKARNNIQTSSGTVQLTDVILRQAKEHGAWLSGGTTATLTRVTAESNGKDGVLLQGSGSRIMDRITAQNNGAWGVELDGATGTSNSLTNSTLKNNVDGGVRMAAAKCAINHNNLTYNGFGIKAQGGSSGAVSANNIKYNNYEGVFAYMDGSSPTIVVNGNNIFGNSAVKGGIVEAPALSATTNASFYGTQNSSVYDAVGEVIEFVKAGYSEYDYDYYNYENGYLVGKPGDASILSWSTSSTSAWTNISGNNVTQVYARVVDNQSSSYYATATVDKLFYHKSTAEPARYIEMSVVIPSGTIDAKQNYWGVGGADVQSRVVQSETNVVDFSGFKTVDIAGCGPQ